MNTRGGCQKGGGGHKKVGNVWKGKYCFAKNKKKRKEKYKVFQDFSNMEKIINTTLNLLINIIRGTVFSIWTMKCQKLYPII